MDLIKIEAGQISGETVQTVNARDLFAFLESKRDFSDWMRERIALYEFVQGVDFIVVPQISNSIDKDGYPRASKRNEFFITLDMAKEIAMVERNQKGKEARQYFIECERKAKAPADPMKALNDPAVMRSLLLGYSEKVLTLEAENRELTPKAAALDLLSTADGSLCITDAAKTLQIRPSDLFKVLRARKWIYKRPNTAHDVAYQSHLSTGFLEHKTTTINRADGTEKITTQVRITPRGLTKLAQEMQIGMQ